MNPWGHYQRPVRLLYFSETAEKIQTFGLSCISGCLFVDSGWGFEVFVALILLFRLRCTNYHRLNRILLSAYHLFDILG